MFHSLLLVISRALVNNMTLLITSIFFGWDLEDRMRPFFSECETILGPEKVRLRIPNTEIPE